MPTKTARRLFPACKFAPTDQTCVAANGTEMRLRGEFLAIVSCKDANGDDVTARVRFYLSNHISEVYLSLSAAHPTENPAISAGAGYAPCAATP